MTQVPSWFTRLKKRSQYECSKVVNRFIDLSAGIHTEFCRNPVSEEVPAEMVLQAKRYQPTSYRLAFRSLRWCHQNFPTHRVLDLGCGAGRVLAVAAFIGFTDIYGVEIDEELCVQARHNLQRFSRRYRLRRNIAIFKKSVTEYQLDGHPWLIYLFHPFSALILQEFLELNRSVLFNQDCLFVYVNPRHGNCLESIGYSMVKSWGVDDFNQTTRIYRKSVVQIGG